MALEKQSDPGTRGGRTKSTLTYRPKGLRKHFWYKGNLLYLRSIPEEGFFHREQFLLSCIGTSSRILKEFLDHCNGTLEKQTESKTAIYMNGDGRWELATRRGQKRTDTIILPDDVKEDFLNDIEEHLDPEAIAWYVEHDLPYRRDYLLHGDPGTGESSLSLAAAGKFGLDVYAMNLSRVSDAALHKLLSKLPPPCIILLEDIDVIESAKSRDDSVTGPKKESTGSVTLSGLLNAIDGVASKEGRVLIMTTNHADRIDPALIRPGRVDKMVKFGLANREMVLRLFRFIYMPLPSKTEKEGGQAMEGAGYQNAQRIQDLAVQFADCVPEMQYSPAKILSFLIAHKRSAQDAVNNIISWVESGGEGFVPLQRQASTMIRMDEAEDKDIPADLGMEVIHWTVVE